MTAPLGLTAASFMTLGPSGAIEMARLAQDLGYRSFWTAETTGAEAPTLLAAVGQAAPGLDLGTGIMPLQLRPPTLTAMAMATLQSLHPDRDIHCGIGVSSPVITGKWHGVGYGDRPLARVREYVEALRLCLSGESVSFAGDYYEFSRFRLGVRLGERRPQIVLGALNEQMLALGGEIADGVLLNYVPATHVGWSIDQVRRGGDATIHAYVHVGVCDRAEALEPARRDLFSYAVVDGYARNFERAGFGAEVADIRSHHAARDREGAVAAVSDRMVDAINIVGSPEQVRAGIDAYRRAGVDDIVVMPLPWGPDRRTVVEATVRAAAT